MVGPNCKYLQQDGGSTMSEVAKVPTSRTPLHDSQVKLGASFNEVDGFEMVDSYGDPIAECARVRKSAGLIDLSFCGAIKIGGSEGPRFLNGLVTNDVASLKQGKGMRAAFLTQHGKVMALCRILGFDGSVLIITEPQTHDKIWKYLFPLSYAGDFKIENVTADNRIISVQGPASPLVMREVCFEPIPDLEEHNWIETIIAGQHVKVVRASHLGDIGYDLLIPSEGLLDVWDFLLVKGAFTSLSPVGLSAFDRLRIEAGLPRYGMDADESNMMLELGLTDAVSFNKGCYKGQEAVAMATYRGHVSKKLSGLVLRSELIPSSGDVVQSDGKEIGHVTSSTVSSTTGKVIALAYLKYGHFEPGTNVEVLSQDRQLDAEVTSLPFYTGKAD